MDKCPKCGMPAMDAVPMYRCGTFFKGQGPTKSVACDRIAELTAIVEKLPITADGAPAVPGMTLYAKDGVYKATGISGQRHDDERGEFVVCGLRYCYSTEEARLEAILAATAEIKISDDQISDAFDGYYFGEDCKTQDARRSAVALAVMKLAADYANGKSMTTILVELGLICSRDEQPGTAATRWAYGVICRR